MEISESEKAIGHVFNNKKLLNEALTHASYGNNNQFSYNRLEFFGDAVIGLAFTKYAFNTYPDLNEDDLTELRDANVSTEKFARVAVRHRLYQFLNRNCPDLDRRVKEFEESVDREEADLVIHGGLVPAEKILADIVESVAAAIYIDLNYDLDKMWKIICKLLEPIFTPEDLKKDPHPISRLKHICDKHGKKLEYEKVHNGCFRIYVDGDLISCASASNNDFAKLKAAREALIKLPEDMNVITETIDIIDSISTSLGVEEAKQKLQDICLKKKGWGLPNYRIEKKTGPDHDKRYVCSVEIKNVQDKICGEEERKVKEAEKSAALSMIKELKKKKSMMNPNCSSIDMV